MFARTLERQYFQHTVEFLFLPYLSFSGNVITVRLADRLKMLIGCFEKNFFLSWLFLAIHYDVCS